MNELKQQLQEYLPPIFAGVEIDRLTGKALRWRTIQNIRANKDLPEHKKIPTDCFLRDGTRKVLVVRDKILEWWLQQLEKTS